MYIPTTAPTKSPTLTNETMYPTSQPTEGVPATSAPTDAPTKSPTLTGETVYPTSAPTSSPSKSNETLYPNPGEFCDSGRPQCGWSGSGQVKATFQFALTSTTVDEYTAFEPEFEQAVKDAAQNANFSCEKCAIPVPVFVELPVELTNVMTFEKLNMGADLVWDNKDKKEDKNKDTTEVLGNGDDQIISRRFLRVRVLQSDDQYLRVQVSGEVTGNAQAEALRAFAQSDEFAQKFYEALLNQGITKYEICTQDNGGVKCSLQIGPLVTEPVDPPLPPVGPGDGDNDDGNGSNGQIQKGDGKDGNIGVSSASTGLSTVADGEIAGVAAGCVGACLLIAAIIARKNKKDEEDEEDLEDPRKSKLVWSDSLGGPPDYDDDNAAKLAAQEQALQIGVAMGVASANAKSEKDGVANENFSSRHSAALMLAPTDRDSNNGDIPEWMMSGWVIDKKEIEYAGGVLGTGAFGSVTLVRVRGVLMAAKKLNNVTHDMANLYDVQREAKRRDELLQEVRVLVELQHPNVVRVLGVCLDPGHECVLMEVAKNGTVRDLLDHVVREQKQKKQSEQKEPLPPVLLFSLLRDTILGMQHAHAHEPSSILHRDLKPANILLNDQYRALVSDFGLAAGAASADEAETDNDGVCGSLAYSPPEVLEAMAAGSGALKAAAIFANKPKVAMNGWSTKGDVFSFGILAYEMATGKVPYADDNHTAASLFRDVVRKEIRPHGKKWDAEVENCDPFVAGIIKRCWAHSKDDRPSFEELGLEFEKAAKEEERFATAESVREELRDLITRYQGAPATTNDGDAADGDDRTTAGTILDMLATRKQGLDMSQMEEKVFDHEYGVDAVPEENKRDLTTSFLRFYSGMFREDEPPLAVEDAEDAEDDDPFGEEDDGADPFGEDEDASAEQP